MSGTTEIEVFPSTSRLGAYLNEGGDIVLCQSDAYSGEDALIFIPMDRVDGLVAALFELKARLEGEVE